jgi:iron complex transport system permease protein
MQPLTPKRLWLICGGLAVVLFAVTLFALKLGAVPISVSDLTLSLLRKVAGTADTLPTEYQMIVFQIRLPRILMAILVGAALSVAGAGFQALLRNPLADPYVLGVSSGAALGAILSLIVAGGPTIATPLAAFAGAVATISVVYLLGRRGGQLDSYTLLLAGIISVSFLSALVMFLMTTLPGSDLRGMAFWLMGDLSSGSPVDLRLLSLVIAATIGVVYSTAADLNLMITGEQEALHLGVDVTRVKWVVYLSASLLTGLAVSLCGAIGFVGLLVPHLMRLLFGSDYRVLIPAAALGGAVIIVLADALARTIVAPTELPVGAFTALVGAPLFLYLLRRRMP